jgi:hypothetical protein
MAKSNFLTDLRWEITHCECMALEMHKEKSDLEG